MRQKATKCFFKIYIFFLFLLGRDKSDKMMDVRAKINQKGVSQNCH